MTNQTWLFAGGVVHALVYLCEEVLDIYCRIGHGFLLTGTCAQV